MSSHEQKLTLVTSSEEALLLGESLVLEDLKHEKKKEKKFNSEKNYGYHDDIGFNMEVPGCKEAVMA